MANDSSVAVPMPYEYRWLEDHQMQSPCRMQGAEFTSHDLDTIAVDEADQTLSQNKTMKFPMTSRGGHAAWIFVFTWIWLAVSGLPASALEGMIRIHDPSTVVRCDGTYYVFGTGPGIPILTSGNGFEWQRAGRVFDRIPESVRSYVPKNDGSGVWAPDVIKLNGEYYLYYSVSVWGPPVSAVGLVTSPTLDPKNPKYKWTDHGMVVHSIEGQNLNSIDPGVMLAPDGRLWICYGSFIGNIELMELDPKTGLRIAPDSPISVIASQSEASDLIFHDGYYYLFVNHGSCCQGINSTYTICVGRSRNVTGPYLDRRGDDMANGGGSLFLASAGRQIGPGHFGLMLDDGVEKFSCHYEGELGGNGRSFLEIRPLLWSADGWPLPGENVKEGTYQIRSQRSGDILQGPAKSGGVTQPAMARYVILDRQKWMITPAGGGYYKIIGLASGDALQVAADNPAKPMSGGAVTVVPFHGADNQLWKIDQLADGCERISAKTSKLALTAGSKSGNGIVVENFSGNDTQRWVVAAP